MSCDTTEYRRRETTMDRTTLLNRIAGGRTDLVFELLRRPDWRELLHLGPVQVMQWFVYSTT